MLVKDFSEVFEEMELEQFKKSRVFGTFFGRLAVSILRCLSFFLSPPKQEPSSLDISSVLGISTPPTAGIAVIGEHDAREGVP
jgi:hypothetical protein